MTKDKQTQIKSGGCYQSLPACAWPHALIHVVQRPGSWTSSRANGNDGRMMEPLRRSSIPFLGDSADSLRYPRNPRNYFPIGTRPGCISGGKDMFPVVPWPNLPPPKKKNTFLTSHRWRFPPYRGHMKNYRVSWPNKSKAVPYQKKTNVDVKSRHLHCCTLGILDAYVLLGYLMNIECIEWI
jgi:hypothetical protein